MKLSDKRLFLLYQKKKNRSFDTKGENSEVSSISDIAFLLLIFFVVTSSFFVPQGIFFQLPSNKKIAQEVPESQVIEINVLKEDYSISGSLYTTTDLMDHLKEEIKEDPKKITIIYMSRELPYNRLTQTFDIVRGAGGEKLALKESK